jgi:hypothetical protein
VETHQNGCVERPAGNGFAGSKQAHLFVWRERAPNILSQGSIFTSSAIDAHNLARFSASRSEPISMLIVRFDAPVAWRIFVLSLCGQQ